MIKLTNTSPQDYLFPFKFGCAKISTRIARLCHIGQGFLKFSLILFNSERKICGNVM